MSLFDPDNMLLYLQEITKFAEILTKRGHLYLSMKEALTDQTRPILKHDLERATGFKVEITASTKASIKPKTHPHVYLIKRLDEEAEMEADHEDVLLLQSADRGQSRETPHQATPVLPKGSEP